MSLTSDKPVRHFALDVAIRTAELIADPAVGRRWTEPSVLPGYRVGGLAAHLGRAVETVTNYVRAEPPPPDAALVDAANYYSKVLGTHDPVDSEFHRAVRDRGESRVDDGHLRVAADVASAASWLSESNLDLNQRVSVLAGTAMRLQDYLDSRLTEMLIHGHDLAASVGIDTPKYDDNAWAVVAHVLWRTATIRHGNAALALALARPTESMPGAFTVPQTAVARY
jgi:Mycothiol maleylpyruvate isomerase N-terminal domain